MLREWIVEGVKTLVDEDARYEGVLVGFTGRTGGISRPPYASLDLSDMVGDEPAAVEANRRKAAAALGFDAEQLVLARQVHGCMVLEAELGTTGVVGEADVLVTRRPGTVIGILTADCVPVVLAGDGAVAVAHAGWRGLVGGVIEAAVSSIGSVTKAWIGPSIHACCYEVGDDVIQAFEERGLPVADASHVDPGRAAIAALHRAGVPNVEATTDCTSCSDGYFSFRRDGVTGRQGAFAALLTP